jgi:KaiC/GvpD/RAD55 family RecA-like ATPase
MNQQLANETLTAILFNFAFVDGFYEACLKSGIAGRRWPDFQHKKTFEKFEFLAKEKTVKAAMYEISESIEFEFQKSNLPSDIDSLKKVFDSACDFLFAKELMAKLKSNPLEFRSLLQEFSTSNQSINEVQSIEKMIQNFVIENEKRIAADEFEIAIPGWPVLSHSIGGFNPGRLTIISAGTGVGKTNLSMNFARCLWEKKIASLYVNMEMDLHDVATRFLTSSMNVSKYDFNNPAYFQKIQPITKQLDENQNKMFFTSGRTLSLTDIAVLENEHKEKFGIKFLFVDYDQKINSESSDDEWRFVQKACESLEEIAKRLKIHVILLAQADENGEGIPRASKRMLQSASTALFFKKEIDGNFYIKAIKNRHGQNGFIIEVDYDQTKSKITELGLADAFKLEQPKKQKLYDPIGF